MPDALDRYKHEYEDLIGLVFFVFIGSIFIVHSVINLLLIKNGYPQKNIYIYKTLSIIILLLASLFLIVGYFQTLDKYPLIFTGLLLFVCGYSGFIFYGANKNT